MPDTHAPWTAPDVFGLLRRLSPLRVISECGPSVFEAIVDFDRHGFAHGHMNAMTPTYHWHLALDGLGWIRTRDEIHERSGRRVLYLEFARSSKTPRFLSVYVHRDKGEDFDDARLGVFEAAHDDLRDGRPIEGRAMAEEEN